jgi:pimeloyl-ACP methyl ester carboxylesterase
VPKIPLVLLPGLVCDEEVWEHQIVALRDIADCLVPDYGERDSLVAMAEQVLEMAPAHFTVAGHSMGGRVAFEIVRRAPERVTRLALMDTRPHPKPGGEAGEKEAAGRYELLEIARTRGMRAMGEKWLPGMLHPSRHADAALTEPILGMIERKTPEIFHAQTRALLGRRDAAPLLQGIACPTLVLCGREDAWSQLSWHEEMARAIPNARLAVIENCGHMATMERPDEVSAAMRNWLTALPF